MISPLWGCTLSYEMFEADKMVGSVRKDLMDMKVAVFNPAR